MEQVPARFQTTGEKRRVGEEKEERKTLGQTLRQMEGGVFGKTLAGRGSAQLEEEEEMDDKDMQAFADKYLEASPPSQKWDVEEGAECLVIRHVRNGIMAVLSFDQSDQPLVKLVSSFGKVMGLTRAGGMEDATLSAENQDVVQRFASRL